MLFLTVFQQLVSLMLIAAAGIALTKLKIIDGALATGMSGVMTKACLPCVLISGMQLEYDIGALGDMGTTAGGFILVMALSATLVLPLILVRKSDLKEAGILIICASFPNVVYIGRPLLEAMYGEMANLPVTVVTLVFSSTVFSIGVLLATMGGKTEFGGVKGILRRSFINPAVVSGVTGILLFLFSVKIPSPVLAPMRMMAGMTTPLAMLIIGYSLTQTKLRELFSDARVWAITFARLILAPIAVFFALSLFIKHPVILGTLTVGASLPVGANAGVIARLYDNNPVFAAKCIFLSSVLAVFTAPVMITLLLGGAA